MKVTNIMVAFVLAIVVVFCIAELNLSVERQAYANKMLNTEVCKLRTELNEMKAEQAKQNNALNYLTHPYTVQLRTKDWIMGTGEFNGEGRQPCQYTTASISAYTADPQENGGFTTTASGLPLEVGGVAMDGNVPFGTVVYIEGFGNFVVTNRFGGGYGLGNVDMFTPNKGDAFRFGRQNRDIYIMG